MDGAEFARELIHQFGSDRFYHCYIRMGGSVPGAIQIHVSLEPETPSWKRTELLKSMGLNADERLLSLRPGNIDWDDMCMVAYGFCKHWKELGRKTFKLPDNLHARMILGGKNQWSEKYVMALDELEAETDQRP